MSIVNLRCPFIKNVGSETWNSFTLQHLRLIKNICPYVSKISTSSFSQLISRVQISKNVVSKSCPHIHSESTGFDYNNFFDEKISQKKDNNTYRIFKRINRNANQFPSATSYDTDVNIASAHHHKRKDVTVWCSNDYLGLSRHPKIIENAIKTVRDHGVGSGGTRNISGNQLLHEKLEHSLAKWYQKDAGLIFTSCYVANSTTLYTLGRTLPGCVILSDAGNHASMIEGICNSKAPKYIFKHNDPEDLERILSSLDIKVPKIVAFESLNSMNGSISPIKKLCDIAHKYNALTFVDEVHATGLYGCNGSGQGEAQGCLEDMDIISGTFGKAVGSMGGFIVGNKNLVDVVRSYGSGLIFTTSLPPVIASTALMSIEILMGEEGRELRRKHQDIADSLRNELMRNGFPIFHSTSHILPIHVGNAALCRKISDLMIDCYDIYVQAINYPTVAFGTERLRIAPSPKHNEELVMKLIESLSNVWKALEIPFLHPRCEKNCQCVSRCVENNVGISVVL